MFWLKANCRLCEHLWLTALSINQVNCRKTKEYKQSIIINYLNTDSNTALKIGREYVRVTEITNAGYYKGLCKYSIGK